MTNQTPLTKEQSIKERTAENCREYASGELIEHTEIITYFVEQEVKLAIMKERKRIVEEVSRVEVIDETGRQYVRWNCKVEQQLQDDGRTLKLFVKALENNER